MLYENSRDITRRFDPTMTLVRRQEERDRSRRAHGLGDCDMSSVVGEQIKCAAMMWLARGVIEDPSPTNDPSGTNKGGWVDEINRRYFGSTAPQPWCVSFAWVVVDDACRALGIANPLPGAQTSIVVNGRNDQVWGNTVRTRDAARAKGLRIDQTPVVGCVFRRNSTKPGDGSSGHMGVVVGLVAGGGIVTVEGNQGYSNRVDQYTYTGQEIASSGFEFIHVEAWPGPCTLVPTADCRPSAPPPTSPPPSQGTPVTAKPLTPTPPGTTGGSSSGGGTTSGGSSTTAKKQQCEVVVLTRGMTGAGTLWGQEGTRYLEFGDDAFGANRETSSAYYQRRNGFAVKMLSGSSERTHHSGLGVVRLRTGRLVYIAQEGSKQLEYLFNANLLGQAYGKDRLPIEIGFVRPTGYRYAEELSEIVAGKRSLLDSVKQGYYFRNETGEVYDINEARYHRPENEDLNILGTSITKDNFQNVLRDLEGMPGRDGLKPVVIRFFGEATTLQSIARDVVKVVELVSAIALPYLPDQVRSVFSSEWYAAAQSALKMLASGAQLSVEQILSVSRPLITAIAPSEALPYVDKATRVYREASAGRWGNVATELGVTQAVLDSELGAMGRTIESLLRDATASRLATQIRDTLTNVQSQFTNLQNLSMLDIARRDFELVSTVQSRLSEVSYEATRLPVWQQLFLNGAVGQSLALIPNADQAVGVLMKNAEEIRRNADNTEMIGNLGLAALGFARPAGIFGGLAFEALEKKFQQAVDDAERKGRQLTEFVIPSTLPKEDRECYAYLLRDRYTTFVNQHRTNIIYNDASGGGSTSGGGGSTFGTGGGPSVPVEWESPVVPPVMPPIAFPPVQAPTAPPAGPPKINVPPTVPNEPVYRRDEALITVPPPGVKVGLDCPEGWMWDIFAGRCVRVPAPPPVMPPPPVPPPSVVPPVTYTPPNAQPPAATPPVVPPVTYTPPVATPPKQPEPPPVIQCPPGYGWDDELKSCVPPRTEPPPPRVIECPHGYGWDDVMQACVPPPPPRDFDRTEPVPPPIIRQAEPPPSAPPPAAPAQPVQPSPCCAPASPPACCEYY